MNRKNNFNSTTNDDDNTNNRISKNSTQQKFEFPGSYLHEIPKFPYSIKQMSLKIFPDFKKITLEDCKQDLWIMFVKMTKRIELDVAELRILSVTSTSLKVADFEVIENNKKLVISLADPPKEGSTEILSISYSAGHYDSEGALRIGVPRNGFHFISEKKSNNEIEAYQSWTQGESTDSRYWFPCIDSPHEKFSIEVEITVPIEFDVISNGTLESKVLDDLKNNATWKYVETNPLPAYLVSVVIGKFSKNETKYREVPLQYYWPQDIEEENAMQTFSETTQMMKFFEDYFDIKYPYKKYSQVAVDNFEFGGMENLSCTTFTRRVLHDKKTSLDYKNDILLIVHELAHQWFGDLVTCKGWSHIWLNEGFATYCESLYLESTKGRDEFQYNLIESTDSYFEEANDYYIRPIVTKVYKQPDELFDAHSYEKAGFILHMLRNFLKEDMFKKALNHYLNKYKNLSATTYDLLETIESVTGTQVQAFFDQWIFRKGHPEIEVEYKLLHVAQPDNNEQTKSLKVIVIQSQDYDDIVPYNFELEIKIDIQDTLGNVKKILHLMQISQWSNESVFKIDGDCSISQISIDPDFKILKSIKSIKVKDESQDFSLKKISIDQLRNGDTVIERIGSVRLLKNNFDEDILNSLREAILNDRFYGVSVEAANTIGSYYDSNNYEKSDKAYEALKSIVLEKKNFVSLNRHVQRAIVKNFGLFERTESVEILESILKDSDIDSDFIKAAAASALGKSGKKNTNIHVNNKILSHLYDLVNTSESFQSVIATGALDGMGELTKDALSNKEIYLKVANFLLQNTSNSKDYFIRAKSTRLLGKFLTNKYFSPDDSEIIDINQKIFYHLRDLTKDDRRKIKMNACEALSDEEAKFTKIPNQITYESIQILLEVAKEDLDGFVRRKAETSANRIREWIHKWSSSPLSIDSESNAG